MIVLTTDFGLEGPYIGQVKAVLHELAPTVPVIDLFADLPPFRPQSAAYLLAAYAAAFPVGSVHLCVVDPGVGSDRKAIIVSIDGSWFVGPDNGVFEPVIRRAGSVQWWPIDMPATGVSASFHGRDLFAPAAARLAAGWRPETASGDQAAIRWLDWPDDLAEIVYFDRFGNAMTGLRAAVVDPNAELSVAGEELRRARTFSDRGAGQAFWYENGNGLVEIAVNQGSAAESLGLAIGDAVTINQQTHTTTR